MAFVTSSRWHLSQVGGREETDPHLARDQGLSPCETGASGGQGVHLSPESDEEKVKTQLLLTGPAPVAGPGRARAGGRWQDPLPGGLHP